MDGRNASGRIISLLNESSDVAAALPSSSKFQLPPLLSHSSTSSAHSRTSSCSASSTPSLSPQTPQLIRSGSSDSRAFSTPSPLTPSYTSFDQATRALPAKHPRSHHHQQQQYFLANHSYAKMDDPLNSMYPPLPDPSASMPSAYPMPAQLAPQTQQLQQQQQQQPQPTGSDSPASEPSRLSNTSAPSNSKAQPKKNQYPCPMAKQIGCTDYFTTSGHAARHAKKHTGKKDALCPECNKAFTRKDNMEQHRRTHQNGRGTSTRTNDDSKVKKTTKAPAKKTTVKPEPAIEAALQQELANQAQVEAVQAQQAVQAAQAVQAQTQAQQIPIDGSLLMPNGLPTGPMATGPYFVNSVMDTGPIPSLPLAMPDLSLRPTLQRSNFANSLEFAPTASMIDPDTLHYSYPSPSGGLSNGLNSLALAASRMAEQSGQSPSSDSSSHGTP